MNIFVLDTDPRKAAEFHCDCHVVKMILETTQILCTVRHLAGRPVEGGYKPTHENHPCTLWVAESEMNYRWTHLLLCWLHRQYEDRYCKVHDSKRLLWDLRPLPVPAEEVGIEPRVSSFIFVGPDECRRDSVVESYRALYRLKETTMKRPMRWKHGNKPEWMV